MIYSLVLGRLNLEIYDWKAVEFREQKFERLVIGLEIDLYVFESWLFAWFGVTIDEAWGSFKPRTANCTPRAEPAVSQLNFSWKSSQTVAPDQQTTEAYSSIAISFISTIPT
jgi:hypothetical protein